MKATPTIQEYYARCKAHDWYHYMSDDRRSTWRAQIEEDALREIASEHGGEYRRLFDGFKARYRPFAGADNRPPEPTINDAEAKT